MTKELNKKDTEVKKKEGIKPGLEAWNQGG